MPGSAMRSFYDWCREQRESAQRGLELMEAGRLSLHANCVDITESHMEHLRRVIADMEELIAQGQKSSG